MSAEHQIVFWWLCPWCVWYPLTRHTGSVMRPHSGIFPVCDCLGTHSFKGLSHPSASASREHWQFSLYSSGFFFLIGSRLKHFYKEYTKIWITNILLFYFSYCCSLLHGFILFCYCVILSVVLGMERKPWHVRQTFYRWASLTLFMPFMFYCYWWLWISFHNFFM